MLSLIPQARMSWCGCTKCVILRATLVGIRISPSSTLLDRDYTSRYFLS